jgi:hypothetical protein
VRIGAAFREVFCRRFRLGSNFSRFFAVRHKSPRFRIRWHGHAPGGAEIESWRATRNQIETACPVVPSCASSRFVGS